MVRLPWRIMEVAARRAAEDGFDAGDHIRAAEGFGDVASAPSSSDDRRPLQRGVSMIRGMCRVRESSRRWRHTSRRPCGHHEVKENDVGGRAGGDGQAGRPSLAERTSKPLFSRLKRTSSIKSFTSSMRRTCAWHGHLRHSDVRYSGLQITSAEPDLQAKRYMVS